MRANRLSFPKVRHCYNRAPRADYPDRPRPLHDNPFAFGISVQHPVAARLVVGPDVVRDVGVGNERYDTVVPSGNGVGSEVDGGHYRCWAADSRASRIVAWDSSLSANASKILSTRGLLPIAARRHSAASTLSNSGGYILSTWPLLG